MRKILGMPATLFVMALLVIGVGTAVLVKYFSNSVTHTVDVTSPLEIVGDTPLSISVFGGDNIAYTITTRNLANVSIDSYPVTEVTGPDIWDGTEFTAVSLEDGGGVHDITALVYVIKDDGSLIPFSNAATLNTTTLKLFFDSTLHTYTRSVGYDEQISMVFTTNPAILPGTYTVKSCELYDWSGVCP